MSIQEIKSEIQNILLELPEDSLKEILEYLKEVKKISSSQLLISKNSGKILKEDTELLKRLAE